MLNYSIITRLGVQQYQTKVIRVHNAQPQVLTGVLARNGNKAFTDSALGKIFLNGDIFSNALILTYENHLDKNSSILLTFGFKIKEWVKQFHRILLEKELFSSWRRLLTFAQQLFLISILSKKEKNSNDRAESLTVHVVISNSSRQRKAAKQGTDEPCWVWRSQALTDWSKTNKGSGGTAPHHHQALPQRVAIKKIKLLHLTNPTDKSISKRLGELFATQKSEISQWN